MRAVNAQWPRNTDRQFHCADEILDVFLVSLHGALGLLIQKQSLRFGRGEFLPTLHHLLLGKSRAWC
ncbi:Uncharacterised protein [Vibrio cholerae]|nr:Uncharacterised protein [Vibrio cholerae]